ncbi:MAG: substrate-binding domain-containing protein [Planctomycetaceae bacterium]|nr:substrate-binding domain-containing protein [Planctomycetaceae bacterium]
MKKFFLYAAAALLVTVTAGAGDQFHIGYSSPDTEDSFQLLLIEAAKQEAVDQRVILTVEDAREQVDLQLQQVDKMIAAGVDALLVVPVNTSDVDEIVKKAQAAKIPLVFVNRNAYVGQRPPDNCYVIATDAYVEGETQMNYAGPLIGSDGNVVIFQGILSNEATQSRTRGVKEVISQSYPELAITAEATANWRRDQATGIMREWIKSFGRERIDAVLSNNDSMALGALDALKEAGIDDVIVMGVDGLQEALDEIEAGRMAGTVLQDPNMQGRGAVRIAVNVLKGEPQTQNNILPSELITKENLNHYR